MELRIGLAALLDEAGDLRLQPFYLMRYHKAVVFRIGQLPRSFEPGYLRG